MSGVSIANWTRRVAANGAIAVGKTGMIPAGREQRRFPRPQVRCAASADGQAQSRFARARSLTELLSACAHRGRVWRNYRDGPAPEGRVRKVPGGCAVRKEIRTGTEKGRCTTETGRVLRCWPSPSSSLEPRAFDFVVQVHVIPNPWQLYSQSLGTALLSESLDGFHRQGHGRRRTAKGDRIRTCAQRC
jgi:hypothetical protein